MEESIGVIDIEHLKFKNDALAAFKNYKTLHKKQSGCPLKIFHTDGGRKYIEQFDDCLKENGISHEVTAVYSPEQNRKAKRVNRTIIAPDWAIFVQQKFSKSLLAEITKAVQ